MLATSRVDGIDVAAVPDMKESTRVYDRNGGIIYAFYEKRRTVVPLDRVSRRALEAFQAIEDRKFYHHPGFDLKGIARAALANFRSRRISQGASTITQQLARNTFLTQERSFTRKIQELWLALKIEHAYTKDQIFEYYLNRVYFGAGYYGIEAAARGYFGKSASDLTLAEAALITGLAKAPAQYSPHREPGRALRRRNQVLDAMAQCGYVTATEAAAAKQQPLKVQPRVDLDENSSYAIDFVREQMIQLFGYEKTYNGGLRVYTSLDSKMQAAAEDAMETHLSRIEKHPGFAGISRARYLRTSGARHDAPDNNNLPYLQGALLATDAATGEVLAMVGGRNYRESKFNRAVHARRQPGSAFKPIVYAAALRSGMTPATIIHSDHAEYVTPEGTYIPANSGMEEFGDVSLRRALRKSINTTAIELGQRVGIANVIRCAHDFEIERELPSVVSLPLGAGEVTLLDMVRAYSGFANAGKVAQVRVILRVEAGDGTVLYSSKPAHHTAMDERTAFLMNSMLTDVVDRGTGYGVRTAGYRGPVGGKTGTTDAYRDAWFIGFTPRVVTGVWLGFDAPREIVREGYAATLAVPVWTQFMKRCVPNSSATFPVPGGITRAEVCVESGQLATPACRHYGSDLFSEPQVQTYMEYFNSENVPPSCQTHTNLASLNFAAAP
jgi:penicillin-binding protein 1A